MEKEFEKDVGSDDEQRVLNMQNPDKREFNEHDCLGDLDRDSKANLVLPEPKEG